MRIKTKMLIMFIPTTVLLLCALVAFNYYNSHQNAQREAWRMGMHYAEKYAGIMTEKLEMAEIMAQSLVSVLDRYRQEGGVSRHMLRETIAAFAQVTTNFVGVWMLWDKNAYDNADKDFVNDETLGNTQGRANAYWLYEGGKLVYNVSEDYDAQDYYTLPKKLGRMVILPPYVDEDTKEKTLMTSVAAPLTDAGGKALGVAGIDISLAYLNEVIAAFKPYGSGYAALLSDAGVIVASPKAGTAGNNLEAILPGFASDFAARSKKGEPFSRETLSHLSGERVMEVYAPVTLNAFTAPWYVMVALPLDAVMDETTEHIQYAVVISFLVIAALILLVFIAAAAVARPIGAIGHYAKQVAIGVYDAPLDKKGFSRELHELAQALASMVSILLAHMYEADEKHEQATQETKRVQQAVAEAEKARQHSEASRSAAIAMAESMHAVALRLYEASLVLNKNMQSTGQHVRRQENFVHETVDMLKRSAQTADRMASGAEEAASSAQNARAQATSGATVIYGAIDGFNVIFKETEAIGAQMGELQIRTQNIGGILGIINDIADQTNLLALNAAIEAARAGEAGRGFAVVADEVRKLAEKTMQATTEVRNAIGNVRDSMDNCARSVARASDTAQKTVELGNAAGASLEQMVDLVRTTSEQTQAIAALSREQSSSAEHISTSVANLNELSAMVHKDVDDSSAVTARLEPDVAELANLVEKLAAIK